MKKKRDKKHHALSDMVYEKLYDRIVTGKYEPGRRIKEMQIAEAEGISRAPVREAIRRLSEDRLITLVPRSGCYVRSLTREDAKTIFDIRKRLECLAMEYAFDRFDMAKVARLKEAFEKCRRLDDAKMVAKEVKLDSQLHSLIYETSGSGDLQALLDKLWAKIQLFRLREAMEPDRAGVALAAHVGILDAILAGDKTGAMSLLTEHIEETQRYTLAKVGA